MDIDAKPPNDPHPKWSDRDYLVAIYLQTKIVGIDVDPGVPTNQGVSMKVTFLKVSSKKRKASLPKIAPKAAPISFSFLDDQDDICTVNGVDAASNAVDISSVATITVSTDTPAVCTADTVTGAQFTIHGLAPGTANITCVATWTDGSVGPFTFTLPVTVTVDAAVGIVVTPGVPTVRP